MRIGRSYTRARRHPWVLGKLGDWTLPLGPYTPAQLVVAGGGLFVLVKTFEWWRIFGPIPVAVWAAAIWAVRSARIGGRSPGAAVLGAAVYLLRPPGGRIAGRAAKDRRPRLMLGGLVVEHTAAPHAAGGARAGGGAGRRPRGEGAGQPVSVPRPTALQQLLVGGGGR